MFQQWGVFMPIPKMYLAQIQGRCSLQYTAEDDDRQQWLKEWIDPKDGWIEANDKNRYYQHQSKGTGLGLDNIYRVEVKFPWRVFSNSGLDSIQRPVLGKNGIPYIPGSSIKGLFKRACNPKQRELYCGNEDNPGCLRFHGAYPIGDWAKKDRITERSNGQEIIKTIYLIEDVVHPQQKRQTANQEKTSASSLISFYKPTMSFEFSSSRKNIVWQEVKDILHKALSQGVGGKTSTGYGFANAPEYAQSGKALYKQAIHIQLEGTGVSSKLINGKPEFRPNLFKAVLRGHAIRLLSGLVNSELTDKTVDNLFGKTDCPGVLQIYWANPEQQTIDKPFRKVTNPTYKVNGTLHIYSPDPKKVVLINLIMQFAFVMGGFGKSWRRVSHEEFYQEYFQAQHKYDIGCHWKSLDKSWISVNSSGDLAAFIDRVRQGILDYLSLSLSPSHSSKLREAWEPNRVAVYSKVVTESQAIRLFHDDVFKHTPAIGGRNVGDERPTAVSSVWHRMLPLDDGKNYLEIVTLFHHDRSAWQHTTEKDQLSNFIQELKSAGLTLSWGSEPT